jgi:hypothetical protein
VDRVDAATTPEEDGQSMTVRRAVILVLFGVRASVKLLYLPAFVQEASFEQELPIHGVGRRWQPRRSVTGACGPT